PELTRAEPGQLLRAVKVAGPLRHRLIAVLGSSAALGDHLARHPADWAVLRDDHQPDGPELRDALLRAVGADPAHAAPVAAEGGTAGHDRLRRAYHRRLLALAARDLSCPHPTALLPAVGRELADLAAAALEAALAIGRAELAPDAVPCRLSVIGMGKCGGRELNYVSDVDVVFVAEPVTEPDGGPSTPGDDQAAMSTAHQLASAMMRACSAVTAEGTLWPVDANLRPEGTQGPLVRSLASHQSYYERWAKTWEFQALLKARPVAGDVELGEAYCAAIAPMVWHAAARPHFVEDVQAMRRRVEQHLPPAEADREIKLGVGGLRDVEFSVQLLQLVHGRDDETLRDGGTLTALAALADGGYVGRDDAASLDAAYRLLRTLEHRIQLFRLRRTHLMPTSAADLRRLGRQLSHRADPARAVVAQWQRQAREVRRLHERLFYRPLLSAVAQLSSDDVRLSTDAARKRLAALGYRDPAGALRHLEALTSGVSRRAAIQRHLLPVMLGWFADEADPDAGLLAFRQVSDELGSTHWYLKMLRDQGAAAEHLAHVLARSRFAGDLLQRAPESVAVLGDDSGLRPREPRALRAEVLGVVERHEQAERGVMAARGVRRRELFRIATADLLGRLELDDVESALTAVGSAVLEGALTAACRAVERTLGAPLPTRMLVVGMGRFGGGELGYGSDADVLFVHDPLPGASEQEAQSAALSVAAELRVLMARPGPDPALQLDADLRPEGKQGPLVRTLASYRAYYQRWSLVWEAQALLRATPLAGDEQLGRDFRALIDPVRWPAGGISDQDVREVRRVKARVEAERLPRGADRARHLKLGRGGMADVEWTVQLIQLRHAHEVPGLRHTGTISAMLAATEAGLLSHSDAEVLARAWTLTSRLRNAAVLWRGRPVDALPSDLRDLDGVGRIVGYPPASSARIIDDYQRTTRQARSVVERVFYE
ncbi:MAG TPA: bifunctional [glutamine synthetase] adenylyltransferase/[glutamine synthetase]-adenylyl-L-tyrosine phosphorylase, partial [Actinomycetales bacterium]